MTNPVVTDETEHLSSEHELTAITVVLGTITVDPTGVVSSVVE